MKTPLTSTTLNLAQVLKAGVLTLAALIAAPMFTAQAADIHWIGGTADYNIASNWDSNSVPISTDNAFSDNGLGNVMQINNGDPDWTVNDFHTAGEANSSGATVQNGATVTPISWFHIGSGSNSVGVYTLNNGTLHVQASGRLFLCEGPGSLATLNINGGVINKDDGGNPFVLADGNWNGAGARTGVVNQTAGIVNSSAEIWLGQTPGGYGFYNLSGGTINLHNWLAVGRGGGTGLFVVTGGTFNKDGNGNFLVGTDDGSVGELDQSGGTINCQNQYLVPQGGNGNTGSNVVSGTAILNVNDWIAIGRNGGVGVLNISGAAAITHTGGGNFDIGGGGPGTVNQNGGAVTNLGGQTWVAENSTATWNLNSGIANLGTVHIAQTGSGSGTLNVNGGLLIAAEITSGAPGVGFSELNLNGGTVQASANNLNFMHDLSLVFVGPGTTIIDSQGFNITAVQALQDAGGGLTKNGSGTLNLTGANSYSGLTTINAGTLGVTTASTTGSSGYTVANGAALGVQVVGSLNSQFTVPGVTLAGSATALNLDLGDFGNPTSAPLNVAGALAVNGTVTVNVLDSTPALGPIPLVKYGSKTGAGSFVIGSLPVGVVAVISNDVANSSIDLVITGVNVPRWEGLAGGNWDIGVTTNWLNVGTGLPTFYTEGSFVLLDDNAAGTTTVSLVATVNPGGVTVNNNTLLYTLTGPGKISGSTGLTKKGANTLAIANAGGNNYTGPTVIAGGTLSVASLANGGSPSAIGASSASPTNLVLAGGTLSYSGPAIAINRGYDIENTNSAIDTESNLTLSGVVTVNPSGGFGFIKSGPAQLAYKTIGTNALSAADYIVQNGTVLFDGSTGGQTNIIQGGRLSIVGAASNAVVILTNTTLNISQNVDLGNVDNTFGVLTVNSGVNLNIGSWLIMGDGAGSAGTFTLNAGTVNLNNGMLLMGGRAGTASTLNINGGVLNKSGGNVDIADGGWNGSGARTGTVNQAGGTINCNDEIWVGQATLGTASYNLSGAGTINLHNWLAVGRAGGNGTFSMTGGTFNKDGNGNFVIGTGGGDNTLSSVGVFNQSAGTINDSSEYWLAENTGTQGTNNISGTAVLNLSNWMSIGRGGHGVINFSGGAINKTGGGNFIMGDGGNGYLNQSGGTLTCANEFWVGQAGGSTGQYDLSGTGSATVNNWVAIGRGGATGVFNISGGSFTKTGSAGDHLLVGADNPGPGTLNQTGGTITSVLSDTMIGNGGTGTWNLSGGSAILSRVLISENSGVIGTLNLNGGTMTATEVTTGNAGGTSTLNFNGGTLGAAGSNASFLHDLTTANIQAGGAVINSGANVIGIAQPLLNAGGGGGLTKVGNGTLYLNGPNTYTGSTLVNTGGLGGAGIILGPVSVASGARLSPGTAVIGTLTVSNSLSLAAGSMTLVKVSLDGGATNDQVAGLAGVTYAGSLVVTNVGVTSLAGGGTFKLFNSSTPGSGNFSSVTILPSGSGTFNPATGILTITAPLTISPPRVSGGNLILSGTGGSPGAGYTWLNTTNLTTPIAAWTTNTTGSFSGTGTFTNSIPFSTAEPARFFRLRIP